MEHPKCVAKHQGSGHRGYRQSFVSTGEDERYVCALMALCR